MNYKRFLTLILAFSIVGAATVFADDALRYYKGKDVSVVINGKQLEEKGIIINSNTPMLPLNSIADTLQAMVKYDESTETYNIYKPNVHIILYEVLKDKTIRPFGTVYYKGKYDFVIQAQIDPLPTDVYAIKTTIEDPYGKEVYVSDPKYFTSDDQKEINWFTTPTVTYLFKYTGKYTVKCYMKLDKDSDYSLVSEKTILSNAQK